MSDESLIELDPNQKRQYWQQHIEGWQQSGLNQAAYCRQNNLDRHQWTYWKKRLARTDAGVSFVPIKFAHNLPVAIPKPAINLVTVNGYKIEVSAGFDAVTLRLLISVVQAL
jgi:hypothetical protein